ncbi:MAG: response regulator [Syntrophomonadaceae bacterium]
MIVDDEQPCIDELVFLFARHPDVSVSGTYTNPVKALEAARALNPDAVFVDVAMPYISGIDLANKLKRIDNNIQLVFVTAHSRLLEDIKKGRPCLWILKPVNEARLKTIIEHLRSRLEC